jgi:hypothetical protein
MSIWLAVWTSADTCPDGACCGAWAEEAGGNTFRKKSEAAWTKLHPSRDPYVPVARNCQILIATPYVGFEPADHGSVFQATDWDYHVLASCHNRHL